MKLNWNHRNVMEIQQKPLASWNQAFEIYPRKITSEWLTSRSAEVFPLFPFSDGSAWGSSGLAFLKPRKYFLISSFTLKKNGHLYDTNKIR